MATLQKFKLLATQCGSLSGSQMKSPTSSPVFHIRRRRRKTLQMLLSRPADRRRIPDCNDSTELKDPPADPPEKRIRRKLKELFVSSPPFEDKVTEGNGKVAARESLLPASEAYSSGSGGGGLNRRSGRGSLRPVSASFRYRLLRRAWRPMLVTIPE